MRGDLDSDVIEPLRLSCDTASKLVADCIDEYLNADYGTDRPSDHDLAVSACLDLIEAASGALKVLMRQPG